MRSTRARPIPNCILSWTFHRLLGNHQAAIEAFQKYRELREAEVPPYQWTKEDADFVLADGGVDGSAEDTSLAQQIRREIADARLILILRIPTSISDWRWHSTMRVVTRRPPSNSRNWCKYLRATRAFFSIHRCRT